MPIPQEKISQFKSESINFANDILDQICKAYHNPEKSLSGEALKIWKELEEWDFPEEHPIDNKDSYAMYLRIIAMNRFKYLKWKEENPLINKSDLSKWEKVTKKITKHK